MFLKVVWDMFVYGIFNLYVFLFLQYCGVVFINWVIINDEKEIGVIIFFIDEKIDIGVIIVLEKVKIKYDEIFEMLYDILMNVGSNLVIDIVKLIEKDKVILKF